MPGENTMILNDAAVTEMLDGRPGAPTETPDPEKWVIVLRALPDPVPSAVRMRKLLKTALRSLGLRCESVAPDVPPTVVYVEVPTPTRRKARRGPKPAQASGSAGPEIVAPATP